MIPEIKPTAELVGHNAQYRRGSEYVLSLDKLPLGRVVNDKKVQDHHAIIPTRSEHDLGRMGQDELKVYDLVAKRFLAVFHPEAVYERTRVETTVVENVFRTSGRRLVEPGWKARLRRGGRPAARRGRLRRRPAPAQAGAGRGGADPGRRVAPQGDPAAAALHRRVAARRHGDRRQGDRGRGAARGHEGLGHRHPRHAGLDHRAAGGRGLRRAGGPGAGGHREGHPGHPAAEQPPAHLGRSHGRLGAPPRPDRARRGHPAGLHERHRQVHHRDGPGARQAQGRPDRARQARPLPGVRPRDRARTARATRAGRARTRAAAS